MMEGDVTKRDPWPETEAESNLCHSLATLSLLRTPLSFWMQTTRLAWGFVVHAENCYDLLKNLKRFDQGFALRSC